MHLLPQRLAQFLLLEREVLTLAHGTNLARGKSCLVSYDAVID